MLVSFGSLSHYVQELSGAGFGVRDFIHEGNDVIWNAALEHPYAHAGWILVEERAEGGRRSSPRGPPSTPSFLEHFERVAEGGGVALYRRSEAVVRFGAIGESCGRRQCASGQRQGVSGSRLEPNCTHAPAR